MANKKVTKFGWMMIALYWVIGLFYISLGAFFELQADTIYILFLIGLLCIPTILFLLYGSRSTK